MNTEERIRLACYQELAPLNAAHGVMLVRHAESGGLFVKKVLTNYQLPIFQWLQAHPSEGMPRILEAVEEDGRLIVIETYLDGRNLQELLDEQGVFPAARVREIGRALCRILTPLHAAGIVHRDIKPSNVILTAEGSVRLLDLDAARIFRAGDSRDTKLIGTKGYAAPEQYGFGASAPATDIYAVGVLMNMLVTGCFPGEKLPEDPQLRTAVERCTRLEPSARYASAADLEEALADNGRRQSSAVPERRQAARPYGEVPAQAARPYEEVPAQAAPPTGARRFLPPGFRSGNLKNMLFASLWYILMFLVIVQGAKDDMVFGDKVAVIVFTAAAFLGLPAIYCNYLGIRDRIGISRIQSGKKRFWASFGIYAAFLVAVTALGKLMQMLLGGSA